MRSDGSDPNAACSLSKRSEKSGSGTSGGSVAAVRSRGRQRYVAVVSEAERRLSTRNRCPGGVGMRFMALEAGRESMAVLLMW
jgi:hypothetical protein